MKNLKKAENINASDIVEILGVKTEYEKNVLEEQEKENFNIIMDDDEKNYTIL